jgi:hypothetical protein
LKIEFFLGEKSSIFPENMAEKLTLQSLHRQNVEHAKSLLKKCKHGKYWRCLDVIKTFNPDKKTSNLVFISKYKNNPNLIRKEAINVGGNYVRVCRFFTRNGMRRFLSEKKMSRYYLILCQLFDVMPKDAIFEGLKKCGNWDKQVFEKKKLLKWLYVRRKQAADLDDLVRPGDVISWLMRKGAKEIKKVDAQRYKILKELADESFEESEDYSDTSSCDEVSEESSDDRSSEESGIESDDKSDDESDDKSDESD